MDRAERAARRQAAVGQTLEGLQALVDAGPGYCRRLYMNIVQHVDVSSILVLDISLI